MNDETRAKELLSPFAAGGSEPVTSNREATLNRMLNRAALERERRAPASFFQKPEVHRLLAAAATLLLISWGALRLNRLNPEGAPTFDQPSHVLQVVAITGQASHLGVSSSPQALSTQAQVPNHGTLTTQAHSVLALGRGDGLKLKLGSSTQLTALDQLEANNQIELDRGSVHCTVPPQARGKSFQVKTPDARVVVHGTMFRVMVEEHDNTQRTHVAVQEGVVSVHHARGEVRLFAGDHWSSPTPASGEKQGQTTQSPTPETSEPRQETQTKPTTAAHQRSPRPSKRATSAPASSGTATALPPPPNPTLAAEAALLTAALKAERQGQLELAQQGFERLLREYPTSPLQPEARAGLGRVRGKTSP